MANAVELQNRFNQRRVNMSVTFLPDDLVRLGCWCHWTRDLRKHFDIIFPGITWQTATAEVWSTEYDAKTNEHRTITKPLEIDEALPNQAAYIQLEAIIPLSDLPNIYELVQSAHSDRICSFVILHASDIRVDVKL